MAEVKFPSSSSSQKDQDVGVYFQDCLRLLTEYQWIYDFQLTQFFTQRVWENIPPDWVLVLTSLTTDQLNQIPYGYVQNNWPDSLKHFLQTAISLSLPRTLPGSSSPVAIDRQMACGMSPKKQHEVSQLAGLVSQICAKRNCSGIVDVGSGLGYLSLLLSSQLGYRVLGIECEESRCRGAELRTNKLTPDKLSNFKSRALHLKDEPASQEEFKRVLQDYFYQTETCDGTTFCDVDTHCDTSGEVTSNVEGLYLSKTGDISMSVDSKINQSNISNDLVTFHHSNLTVCDENELLRNKPKNCLHCKTKSKSSNMTTSPPGNNSCCIANIVHDNDDLSQLGNEFRRHSSSTVCSAGSSSSAVCSTGSNSSAVCSSRSSSSAVCPAGSSSCGVCLIGLHCCGDLTPTMLRLFCHIQELQALVALSCCYHHMAKSDSGRYAQFPMSKALTLAMADITRQYPNWSLSTYALRLAAQETRSRWRSQTAKEHQYHQNNVVFRGILDIVMETEGITLLKDRRKLVAKQQCVDFETYVDTVIRRLSLPDDVRRDLLRAKLLQAYSDHQHIYSLVEPFTSLQVMLQGVIESLILRDRLQYLHECGLNTELIPVMDDYISPRNMALVAWKGTG